jgi:hypothetical protein
MNKEQLVQQINQWESEGISPQEIQKRIDTTGQTSERGLSGEILPIAGQTIGSFFGPAGGFAGGVIGETAQQELEKLGGSRESLNIPQIGVAGAVGAIPFERFAGLLKGIAKPALKAAKPIVEGIDTGLAKFIGRFTGLPEGAVDQTLKRTPGVIAGSKEGETAVLALVRAGRDNLGKLADEVSTAFGKGLEKVNKNYKYGETFHILNMKEVGNFIGSATRELRANRIGVKNTGELIFEKGVETGKASSRISSAGEQKNIQKAYNELLKLKNNSSPKNVEAVLENIRALKKFETSTGLQSSAVVENIFQQGEKLAKKLYPDLAKLRTEYGPQREIINDAKYLFGKTGIGKSDIAQESTAVRKILNLYNTGNLPLREATEQIGKALKLDIKGTAAGALLKEGEAYSFKASNLSEKGFLNKFIEGLPRKGLQNYAQTGSTLGGVQNAPLVKALQKLLEKTTTYGARPATELTIPKD